jgi:putative ABC transport system permease protein
MFSLALRNFIRNYKKYRLLTISIAIAVLLITIFSGLTTGIRSLVVSKASKYFSGNILVTSYQNDARPYINDVDLAVNYINNASNMISLIAPRSISLYGTSRLFYNGTYMKQRRVIGIDWGLESSDILDFDFKEGGYPESNEESSILISNRTADIIGVSVGDSIILNLNTSSGQVNTIPLIVSGIYLEDSFFGFASYMDRKTLNTAMSLDPNSAIELAIYVRNGAEVKVANQVLNQLAIEFPVFPIFNSQDDRDQAIKENEVDGKFAIMTLDAQLDQFDQLLLALQVISSVVILFFLSIIGVGILNAYRLILVERVKEIGTMRAVGMQRFQTVQLFVTEILVLASFSYAIGFVGGVIVLEFLSCTVDLSSFGWAHLFLRSGKLSYHIEVMQVAQLFVFVNFTTLLAALPPIYKYIGIQPVEALREK